MSSSHAKTRSRILYLFGGGSPAAATALRILVFLLFFSLPSAVVLGWQAFRGALPEELPLTESFMLPVPKNNQEQLQVAAHDSFNVSAERDFMLFGWVYLVNLPEKGERLMLVSKYREGPGKKPGYAVSVVREGEGARFQIYWQDNQDRGEWYTFPMSELPRRRWLMYLLRFQEGKILALHTLTDYGNGKRDYKLQGAHQFESAVVPANDSPVLFGGRLFPLPGAYGPFGIFQGDRLGERFDAIARELRTDPLEIPESLKQDEISLWVDLDRKDHSRFKHAVIDKRTRRR